MLLVLRKNELNNNQIYYLFFLFKNLIIFSNNILEKCDFLLSNEATTIYKLLAKINQ